MALELVTMNPPTGEGFEGLEPIRVPKSSVRAWQKRGWTLAEDQSSTAQATNAQGDEETTAPTATSRRSSATSNTTDETTTP